MTIKSRPGGRTARTRELVFRAVTDLVAERGHAAISMTDVAERAGVAATSLYRRWGDIRVLMLEVATAQLTREHPLPDTGSLAGDLRTWARAIAAGLRAPAGSRFFQALVATAVPAGETSAMRAEVLRGRGEQIATMLTRAAQRGEQAPAFADVMDHLLAPLYMRALFGTPGPDAFAERLVDKLLSKD